MLAVPKTNSIAIKRLEYKISRGWRHVLVTNMLSEVTLQLSAVRAEGALKLWLLPTFIAQMPH